MSMLDDLIAAKAEVARIEAEMAALPPAIVGKSAEELSDIFHAIRKFFGGKDPEPNASAAPDAR